MGYTKDLELDIRTSAGAREPEEFTGDGPQPTALERAAAQEKPRAFIAVAGSVRVTPDIRAELATRLGVRIEAEDIWYVVNPHPETDDSLSELRAGIAIKDGRKNRYGFGIVVGDEYEGFPVAAAQVTSVMKDRFGLNLAVAGIEVIGRQRKVASLVTSSRRPAARG